MITCAVCPAEAVVQWRRLSGAKDSIDTEPVYACADHALSPDAASYVHKATCSGPGKDGACACPAPAAPEFPFVDPDADPEAPSARRLPPGW